MIPDRDGRTGRRDTVRAPHWKWQRLVPRAFITLGLATLALGMWGLWGVHAAAGAEVTGLRDLLRELTQTILAVLFDAAGLIVLEQPPPEVRNWPLSLARFTGVATAGLGVLYIVLGVYRESADQLRLRRFGLLAAGRRRRLVVICGLGRIGRQLVSDLTAAGAASRSSVVVIEVDAGNPGIQTARERGAVVLVGDARDAAVQRRARLHSAEQVFVVCGEDSANLDVAAKIVRDVEAEPVARSRALHCYANVVSATLARAARDNPAFASPHGRIRFEIFNVVENSARQLVKEELARRHAPRRDEVAHYIVYGFGTMGQAAALQAGKLAHFENDRRLRMSIIDDWEEPAARKARRTFLERHPAFCPDPATFDLASHVQQSLPEKDAWHHRAGRPADPAWRADAPLDPAGDPIPIEYAVNAEFLELPTDVDAPRLLERLTARLTPDRTPSVRACVIVCFDDDRRNLEAALRISAALRREGLELPLFVYLPDEPGLATFLTRGREEGPLGDVRAFGECEVSAAYSRLVQPRVVELATTFRESYRAAGHRAGGDAGAAGGPLDLAFWASNQEAAHHADIKLAAVERMRTGRSAAEAARSGTARMSAAAGSASSAAAGMFTAAEREALARMEHNRYVAERLLEGWRYGPRDDAGKRRESLIPWRSLPERERAKDFEQIEAFESWLAGKGSGEDEATGRAPTTALGPTAGAVRERA